MSLLSELSLPDSYSNIVLTITLVVPESRKAYFETAAKFRNDDGVASVCFLKK